MLTKLADHCSLCALCALCALCSLCSLSCLLLTVLTAHGPLPLYRLAVEVRSALAEGVDMVLIHENDASHDGCRFERLFETTPQDLIVDGLYTKIAVAFWPRPHREVSLALAARALGASDALALAASAGAKLRHSVRRNVATMAQSYSSRQSCSWARRSFLSRPSSRRSTIRVRKASVISATPIEHDPDHAVRMAAEPDAAPVLLLI